MSTRRRQGTVAVVGGAGAVGSTTAFALADSRLVDEIVLVDIDDDRAVGEAMDLRHGTPFTSPVSVRTGGYEDCWDADVVIVTAGASQAPDETRLDLLDRNAALFAETIPQVTEGLDGDAVLLVVTNPVDALTHVARSVSGLPAERVIGSGTVLDTARLHHALSREFDLTPADIDAYVIGEHGDSAVPVWSATRVGGVPFGTYCAAHGVDDADALRARLGEEVRNAAYEIIDRKGRTNYAVARSVATIVETVLGGDNAVLTVSTPASGHHGIDREVHLSLPCVVGSGGVRDILELDLSAAERDALADSAAVVRESIGRLSV
jgi:L-lactate dehydrogenase